MDRLPLFHCIEGHSDWQRDGSLIGTGFGLHEWFKCGICGQQIHFYKNWGVWLYEYKNGSDTVRIPYKEGE